MKKSVSILFIAVLIALVSSNIIFAQKSVKLGHINSATLLDKMPGRDSAKTKIETYAKELQGQLKEMQDEFDLKYKNYQSNEKTMSDLVKKTKTDELKALQDRRDGFQKTAQEDIQKKENELLKPIIDKVRKAIEDVAKENKYTYIFDTASGLLLYFDAGDDVMTLVKKKLRLK